MRFDTVRAWKDENYRQSLSDEQLNTLPANPAGEMELTNEELESGWGGQCCGGSFFGFSSVTRFHSLAFRCDERAFSITAVSAVNVISPITPICVNEDEDFI